MHLEGLLKALQKLELHSANSTLLLTLNTRGLVYKCVNGLMPTYLSSPFMESNSGYSLRDKRKLVLSKPETSTRALNSFTNFAMNHWNLLTKDARTASNIYL